MRTHDFDSFSVIDGTSLPTEKLQELIITKGHNSTKNVHVVTVVVCSPSDDGLYFCTKICKKKKKQYQAVSE